MARAAVAGCEADDDMLGVGKAEIEFGGHRESPVAVSGFLVLLLRRFLEGSFTLRLRFGAAFADGFDADISDGIEQKNAGHDYWRDGGAGNPHASDDSEGDLYGVLAAEVAPFLPLLVELSAGEERSRRV